MSAIWGFVDLRRSETAKNGDNIGIIASKMKQPYEKCAIDRFSEEFFDRGFFACGLQYFNSREKKEVLPLVDREKGYIFSADLIADTETQPSMVAFS